jgi:hypothetical protein
MVLDSKGDQAMTALKVTLASTCILALSFGSSLAVGHDGTTATTKTVSPATDTSMQIACVIGKPCPPPNPRPWVSPLPTVKK